MPVTFITGIAPPVPMSRCLTIKLTLKGGAKEMHEELASSPSSPFGPLQGLYKRSHNTCDYPTWARKYGPYPDTKYQRIWWHEKAKNGFDCGKKVSKGKGKNYWKVGDYYSKLSALDSWDTSTSVDQRRLYPYSRRLKWSYMDWRPDTNADIWTVAPRGEIRLKCVKYGDLPWPMEDGPCKYTNNIAFIVF